MMPRTHGLRARPWLVELQEYETGLVTVKQCEEKGREEEKEKQTKKHNRGRP